MSLRVCGLFLFAVVATSSFAAPLTFASTGFANNGTVRNSWLSAMGIANPTITGDFDLLSDGNIHGAPNIYPGLTITSSNSLATVTSSPSLLGSSNPIGLKAVALEEGPIQTLSFATPIDYFSFISIDSSRVDITVNYVGGTTSTHANGSATSSGNSGVFFGLFRNDRPQITSVTLLGHGGDNEWGLDNVEYGTVPEPMTVISLASGAIVVALRRKRS